jgi:hypothetical protein
MVPRARSLITAAAAAILLAGCATSPVRQYSNEEIVALAKEGKTGLQIIDALRAGRAVYDKPASELVTLAKAGVPPEVLDYMQQTHLDEIRRDERWRAYPYRHPGYRPWRGLYSGPFYYRPRVKSSEAGSAVAQ